MERFISSDRGSADFVKRKLHELIVLTEMNKEIHSTMNINQLFQILIQKVGVGVNFERCLLYLLQEDYLRCVVWIDLVKREKASIIEKRVGFRMDENAVEVQVFKTGKPIYVENAFLDKRVSQKILNVSGTKEYGALPLIGRKSVLGVLTGDKFYSKSPILPEDMESLQLFAGHISLAIENAMLYEEKERFSMVLEKTVQERTAELVRANQDISMKMTKLSSLYQMAKLLDDGLEQKAVLYQISALLGSLGFDTFSVGLLQGNNPRTVFVKNIEDNDPECLDLPLPEEVNEEFWKSPHVFLIHNKPPATLPSAFLNYCRTRQIRSFLVTPIISKGKRIGVLKIFSQTRDAFPDEQKDFFYTFGQQAGVALENAIMYQKVVDEKNQIKTISERIEQENLYLKKRIKSEFVIGKSPKMIEVMELVRKVAPNQTTVIIYGETGTGKEHIANAVHEMSPRSGRSLVKVNCAAIPEDLIESELFGHERGAFTGAYEKRIGMFELANGGTIFLDEIGDLSMKTQTKLLRVLQEQEVQRIGSKVPIHVDVRVIAATNKDLQKAIEELNFRSDLYYRLAVFPITLAPLRERKEDIGTLLDFFLNKYAYIRKRKMKLSPQVIEVLLGYSWPGNVRELENVVERLVVVSRNDTITVDDLPRELWATSNIAHTQAKHLNEAIQAFKKNIVIQTLTAAGGKKSRAADILGLPRSNFSRLLKSLNL
ncbi:MAG: sigma 54-interacting transcriptional regulator [Syntrophales bacterium]|jgi:transcriptional regulator with GAF, ATPase, and Fis domain|nr:sigma 54-interacting transcriptional regulator [Syntrophales bacterium]